MQVIPFFSGVIGDNFINYRTQFWGCSDQIWANLLYQLKPIFSFCVFGQNEPDIFSLILKYTHVYRYFAQSNCLTSIMLLKISPEKFKFSKKLSSQ